MTFLGNTIISNIFLSLNLFSEYTVTNLSKYSTDFWQHFDDSIFLGLEHLLLQIFENIKYLSVNSVKYMCVT